MLGRLIAPLLLSCSLWTRYATGLLVNRTIDDELGDVVTGVKPLYSPDGAWNQGTKCSICRIGTSQVDVSQTFDGTWHDATYGVGQPDIEVRATFTGTAVYVYFLVPGTFGDTTTFMNTSFFIDDEPVGQFNHTPDAAADMAYRVPVYTNVALSNQEHTLLMRATGANSSLILFDYIVYTVETDDASSSSSASIGTPTSSASSTSSPSSSHAPVAAIAGGTVGGVVVLAAIAALVFFCLRRRRPRHSRPRSILDVATPYVTSDDELLGHGSPGYKPAPHSPSFLPASASIPYGHSRRPDYQSPDLESPHRQSFHMTPPSSASGTVATEQQAELLQRIRVLEEQISGGGTSPRVAQKPGKRDRVSSEATVRGLQDEVAALRGALAGLRTQLADEGRLASEPLPRYEENRH